MSAQSLFPMSASTAGLMLALISAIGFSMKAIFVKLAYQYGVDAETLLALRMGYSLPVFLAIGFFASAKAESPISRQDWGLLFLLGFLGYYLASYLDFLGLNYISASLERLILFSYPSLVVIISALFFNKPITVRTLIALSICYAGISLAVAHDFSASMQTEEVLLGALLVFFSALSYSLHLVGNGQIVHRIGPQQLTGWASTFACLLSISQFVVMRPLDALIQPWQVHGYALAMALLSTVIPIWCLSQAVKRIGAGPVALMGNMGPILTLGFAWIILDERLGGYQVIGAALVIGGVMLMAKQKK